MFVFSLKRPVHDPPSSNPIAENKNYDPIHGINNKRQVIQINLDEKMNDFLERKQEERVERIDDWLRLLASWEAAQIMQTPKA